MVGDQTTPVASVIVVATNELHHLRDCLPTLAALDGPPTEVIVIDNASDDGTGAALAADYPWVRVVRSDERLGYAPANNLGFRHARGQYLIVLNPDTRVDPGFVRALVETSQTHGDQALVTSRICMYDDPDTINAVGNTIHFSLLAACRGLGEPRDRWQTAEWVPAISGCAFLIPRRVLEQLGPFDESIYPYLEDTELSLRAWLGGFACVACPDSLVFHKYDIRMKPQKFFYIERNRWLVMLRTFRLPTLALLTPPLLVIELCSWIYAGRRSPAYLAAKARSYADIIRLWPVVRAGRRHLRTLRRLDDRALLERFTVALPVRQLAGDINAPSAAITVINQFLALYYALIKRVVLW
ncbi:MAG TPA: glycosyltransferase family 2 protein [Thermomicrobiales bacterium]